MKVDENKNKKLPRKLRKIIVEKKRRERIDTALKQLKDILFGGSELQNDYMRMEKADILENVVKYLQNQQSNGLTSNHPQSTCDAQYRLGYVQCVREVTRIMDRLCGANSQITQSLSHYLNAKITQMTSAFVKHEHSHTQSQAPRVPTHDFRAYPECTSASGVSPDSRVPPLHHSPNSAFHRVAGSRQKTPTAMDNISIAVYQYNHYNNFKNEKNRANAESNINIRPVIEVESPTSTHPGFYDIPKSTQSDTSVQSNINIQPVIKLETQSKPEHSDKCNRNKNEHNNNAFVDTSMWRPW